MMPRRRPKQPSESYEARRARGRVPISVELTPAKLAQLDMLKDARGDKSRADTISAAIDMLDDATKF